MTTKDRFARVMALVDGALDLNAAEREAKLAACEDEAIRDEARKLLAADARAGAFLDEPAVKRAREGTTIGLFRLVSRLGRGGMGEVWIAEREGADFEQRVAVKLLPLTDEAAVARFRRERQILARLVHPRIARLVDGGVTDDGRPWLAMDSSRASISSSMHGKTISTSTRAFASLRKCATQCSLRTRTSSFTVT